MNEPRRVEHQQTDKGYVPVYTTAIVDQPAEYPADDHATWGTLYERQRARLVGRACDEFLQAQDALGMAPDRIPRFDDLNEVLRATTGWTLAGSCRSSCTRTKACRPRPTALGSTRAA